MKTLKLTDERDAYNFRAGDKLVWDDWSGPGGMQVVQGVDAKTGVVTLRDPTRWERLRWWLSTPWRWLVGRIWRWRFRRPLEHGCSVAELGDDDDDGRHV